MLKAKINVELIKIKQQLIFELDYWRKYRLRALVERIQWDEYIGMNKHAVLGNAISELRKLSPRDVQFLDRTEKQVGWVLDKYYGWIS